MPCLALSLKARLDFYRFYFWVQSDTWEANPSWPTALLFSRLCNMHEGIILDKNCIYREKGDFKIKWLSFKKKNTAFFEPEQAKRKTAQDWLPFYDVANSFIFRRDNQLVAVLRIEPINISLKSEGEKKRIITTIHEVLNGQLEPIQIFCLPRPVDLDIYLEKLYRQARETVDQIRKRLLGEYVTYVATVVRAGEAIEHRYYILLSQEFGKHAKEELSQRAFELASNFSRSGLKITVCDDAAILDMLFSFSQPVQAAFEPVPMGAGITVLYKGG